MKTNNIIRTIGAALVMLAFISTSALAQKTVDASEIMQALKAGKDVSYQDVTITGVLDFTFMDEKLDDLPTRRRWWRNGGDNEVDELIKSKVSFVNCTFEDDVLAYFHDKRSEYTFTADFEDDVKFENCTFNRNAMFKYSEFERASIFTGSSFNRESTFKYAEFEEMAQFEKTFFDEDAMFKYTKFRDGANFNDAKFDRSVDMKYTEVRGDFMIERMDVRWDIDTKYAEVNGRSMTRYLIDN
ncbi:pentapeptide repeat-containing protein [Roseivirga sp.]|uniref:pentapeptide repeat-containing protein n=1 Tax=Roseivirga sp. TaxID=1964215 RepID=UPI003B8CF421